MEILFYIGYSKAERHYSGPRAFDVLSRYPRLLGKAIKHKPEATQFFDSPDSTLVAKHYQH